MPSPEIQAFYDTVMAALENIAADLQRIVNKPETSLSEEDKVALEALAKKVVEISEVIPEP